MNLNMPTTLFLRQLIISLLETRQESEGDELFDELHDICKDWFGEELISDYYEECGGQGEEEEEEFMFMESIF